MSWKPKLNVICNRCGKPRTGIRHDCIVRSSRAASRSATPKLKLSFGTCPSCKKPYDGNPLTHVCRVKSDFKKRKAAAGRKRQQPEKHDYQACNDADCPRPLCIAFKTGWKFGYDTGCEDTWPVAFEQGYKEGYAVGFGAGFSEGLRSCPGPHGGN